MYAFTLQDSYQKNHLEEESNQTYGIDWENYHVPTLELNNVEIRNMLYDYQSLVYVEKDNYYLSA